jgi:Transposase DDE domain
MILPPPKRPPAPPFALEVLRRLPLAEAFYSLWGYAANDAVLDVLFDTHRGPCYEGKLSFAQLVAVLADAITRYKGKGRGAILDALEHHRLSCQARAVYGKLSRLPLPLAEAFLCALTARLRPLFPAGLYHCQLPACFADLTVVVVDGKKIKKAAKRLLQTRGQPGKLFGGKVLCAYLPKEGLAVAAAADPDGEANDAKLVPRLLPLAREATAGSPRLWVADRQFADLTQPLRFLEEEGDHVLIRYSKHTSFQADPHRAAVEGKDGQGRSVTQEWGWLGAESQGQRRLYVRRVTLYRGSGQEEVSLITDLLDETVHPAQDLLDLYLARWQIENVFQQITEVFDLRQLIGSAPEATVFQASLCLVIYNALQLVRSYVAHGQEMEARQVSVEMVFEDVKKDLIALHEVLGVEELLGALAGVPLTPEQMKEELARLLAGQWSKRWKKVVNNKPRPHKDKARQSGAHTSVHKVLQQARQAKQEPDKTTPKSRQ